MWHLSKGKAHELQPGQLYFKRKLRVAERLLENKSKRLEEIFPKVNLKRSRKQMQEANLKGSREQKQEADLTGCQRTKINRSKI